MNYQEQIENFLRANPGVYYSVRTISKRLKQPQRRVGAICDKTKNITRIEDSNTIGSGKHKLNVFTII
jgi:hypothetical protein|tara:strand:- start:287 stop:490 length:204 start_codon:yes stop_codon:yes gene_type:complete